MNNLDKTHETYSDFWGFIADYLPGYSWRDDVLESDILCRYVSDEDVWEEDLKWIDQYYEGDKQQVAQALIELEAKFAKEALVAYYEEVLQTS